MMFNIIERVTYIREHSVGAKSKEEAERIIKDGEYLEYTQYIEDSEIISVKKEEEMCSL